MEQANGEHLLDGAVYQNCDEQDPRYITAERKNLLTFARDLFALERGADGAGANEEFDPSYITAERKNLLTFAHNFFALERGADGAGANEEFDPSYITAEHGEDARLGQMRGQKPAFTLAEVLITLAVIGIVAALTIGVFLPKIHSTIRARQIATAEVKFTKAMEQMALNNAIGPYYDTTQEFVDELQNYLKISKVCDNTRLSECFGYDKIKLDDNEDFEIEDLKNGSIYGTKNNSIPEYKESIGIVTIDGTSMLLSWNKNCPILEPKVYPWANNTNETTNCVAIIMDINGDKSPNRKNKDVSTLNAKLGCGVKFTQNGTKYCWDEPFAPTPLTDADCAQNKSKYGITNCIDSSFSNRDYWGGAMKQCKEEGKRLPNQAELKALAQYIYGTDEIQATGTTDKLTLINDNLQNASSALATNYQSRNKVFALWSGVEYSKLYAYVRYFFPAYTGYHYGSRYGSAYLGVCVP